MVVYMHTQAAGKHTAATAASSCLKVAYHVFPIGLRAAAAAADGALEAISVHVRRSPPPGIFLAMWCVFLGVCRDRQIKPVALPRDAGKGWREIPGSDGFGVSIFGSEMTPNRSST